MESSKSSTLSLVHLVTASCNHLNFFFTYGKRVNIIRVIDFSVCFNN
jgi:hypothetical protein